ncbi:flagellar hook-length control protein [Corallococcus coralloides DSM 2259]|uniref:Flagellar hook-length control protein n=2 Tax=Corallococcus coralloides TaxID=184914 RepID=H8N1J9_CORCM|nr:flagellar hook-length control protein [Corallococcus coralloides DSM 2259]
MRAHTNTAKYPILAKTMKNYFKALIATVTLAFAPAADASGGMGMTWRKSNHASGVDEVGCLDCDAYFGDTACTARLPVLCIKQDGSPRPASLPGPYYAGWAGGNIATTLPVAGNFLMSLAHANETCVQFFGPGWRMASFHDAGGWGFNAYGNVRTDTRFWVYIWDQPANCWNP